MSRRIRSRANRPLTSAASFPSPRPPLFPLGSQGRQITCANQPAGHTDTGRCHRACSVTGPGRKSFHPAAPSPPCPDDQAGMPSAIQGRGHLRSQGQQTHQQQPQQPPSRSNSHPVQPRGLPHAPPPRPPSLPAHRRPHGPLQPVSTTPSFVHPRVSHDTHTTTTQEGKEEVSPPPRLRPSVLVKAPAYDPRAPAPWERETARPKRLPGGKRPEINVYLPPPSLHSIPTPKQ